jgi:hypothetical protein
VKLHVEMEKRLAERNPPLVPYLREEGLAAFRDWLEKGDRIPY